MKNLWILIMPILLFAGTINSCDRIDNPVKPSSELDSTLYPGDWNDYVVPTFTQNTNTNRNVLLEDFTGHKCPNCPDGAAEAENIEAANPGRVFVASVHAGPGGLTQLQETNTSCETDPGGEFCTVLYCDEGIEYGSAFQSGYGFFANPMGTINRTTPSPDPMFDQYTTWAGRVSNVLTANDLKVNIQAKSNYYPETRGLFLHTEVEFLEDMAGNYSIVTYLLENEVIAYQDDHGTHVPDYHHNNVFRGCLDGQAWGQSVTKTNAGDKSYFDYSYQLPSGQTNDEFHVLVYVFNTSTYEILQVIEHEF